MQEDVRCVFRDTLTPTSTNHAWQVDHLPPLQRALRRQDPRCRRPSRRPPTHHAPPQPPAPRRAPAAAGDPALPPRFRGLCGRQPPRAEPPAVRDARRPERPPGHAPPPAGYVPLHESVYCGAMRFARARVCVPTSTTFAVHTHTRERRATGAVETASKLEHVVVQLERQAVHSYSLAWNRCGRTRTHRLLYAHASVLCRTCLPLVLLRLTTIHSLTCQCPQRRFLDDEGEALELVIAQLADPGRPFLSRSSVHVELMDEPGQRGCLLRLGTDSLPWP